MSKTTVSTTGNRATATTTGHQATAATTGHQATASTTGNQATAATTGGWAHASTTGRQAHATTTGHRATASTTGNQAHAAALVGAAQTEGNGSVSIGRFVRLTDNGMNAVLLPTPGFQAHIVSIEDDWPTWKWITMTVSGEVVADAALLLPNDGRGYQLRFERGRYIAGCRVFTFDEAVAHWSNPNHAEPQAAALLLAEVVRHHEGTA